MKVLLRAAAARFFAALFVVVCVGALGGVGSGGGVGYVGFRGVSEGVGYVGFRGVSEGADYMSFQVATRRVNNIDARGVSEGATYALIGEGAVLYAQNGENFLPVTTLPLGYFVEVAGERAGEFLLVRYLDIEGYVAASAVEVVDYEPLTKFAEKNSLTMNFDGESVFVRSSPEHTADNVIGRLRRGESVYYYGSVSGSEAADNSGDTWYFVRLGDGERGYVYSLYALASPIVPNVIDKVSTPLPDSTESGDAPDEEASGGFALSGTREILIVIALCLPVVAVMYLLFSSPDKRRRE